MSLLAYYPGSLFTKRWDVLSQDLMKYHINSFDLSLHHIKTKWHIALDSGVRYLNIEKPTVA